MYVSLTLGHDRCFQVLVPKPFLSFTVIMASIPSKKDKGAAAPEANVRAHCLAPEG